MKNFLDEAFNAKYSVLPNKQYTYDKIDILKSIADELKYEHFKYLDIDNNPENYQQNDFCVVDNVDFSIVK